MSWFSKKENNKINDKNPVNKQISASTSSYLPTSSFISTGTPVWRNLSESIYLLKAYCENPIVQAIINIKADAFSNIKFSVRDLKTGEILPLGQYEKDGGRLFDLISRPNPLQSTYEWLKQEKVNAEVFGDAYIYASVPVGSEDNFDYTDINVLNNLPPYCVTPSLTGKWIDATEKSEIIKDYVFTWITGRPRTLNTNTILHLNNVNIRLNEHFTQGRSKLIALKAPITNIDLAYESRNVLIKKRGALGLLTPDGKDEAMGSVPLSETEQEDVQNAFKKYGLLDDQYSQLIVPHPLKYQRMAMSVKDLMLFEEIESDAIAISNAFGVPELLIKYYLKGGTFKNLDASEKRLYDATIIPETRDFMVGINNFFKTHEHGIELLGTFDHLHILQINKKEEAQTIKIKESTAASAFKLGAIVYNEYLISLGLPLDETIGKLRIWDLTPEQQTAIGINLNTQSNEAVD